MIRVPAAASSILLFALASVETRQSSTAQLRAWAYSHLTFQVIGSRLKPGCAEGKIVGTALDLMRRSGR